MNTLLHKDIQHFWHPPSCSSGWMRKHAFMSIFVIGHQRIILTGVLPIKLIHVSKKYNWGLFNPHSESTKYFCQIEPRSYMSPFPTCGWRLSQIREDADMTMPWVLKLLNHDCLLQLVQANDEENTKTLQTQCEGNPSVINDIYMSVNRVIIVSTGNGLGPVRNRVTTKPNANIFSTNTAPPPPPPPPPPPLHFNQNTNTSFKRINLKMFVYHFAR